MIALAQVPALHSRIFSAAQGYCELKMWQDAREELDALPPEQQALEEVLLLRLSIFVGLRQWEPAAVLAESLESQGCHDPDVYISGAYALRRGRSLPEARVFLLRGEAKNPECAGIIYNLACYACQFGAFAEATERLQKACELQTSQKGGRSQKGQKGGQGAISH